MTKRLLCGLLTLAAAACTTMTTRPAPVPVSVPVKEGSQPTSIPELAAAIQVDAQRSDHESDSKIRGELAAEASRNAQACLALEPQSAACQYGNAVALGLQARAHPTQAVESLNNMLQALRRAESADPNYDEAGPARVRALVLLRAPGWPLGPGDTDEGLIAARRAVTLRPHYPPNLLALGEALAKTGNAGGARESYARAREAALAMPPSANRDDWLQEANKGLGNQ